MAEYIEREKVLKFIEDGLNYPDNTSRKSFGHDAIEIMAEVKFMPAADVAPVVHGRWIIGDGDDDFDVKCPVCGWSDVFDVCGIWLVKDIAAEMHYCQNCGAKMDGDPNA